MKKILIIDDNADFRDVVSNLLVDEGYEVWEAECPHDAYSILMGEEMDLIICDLHMPFTTGLDMEDFKISFEVGAKTVKELAWVYPDKPVIALSAAAPSDLKRISSTLEPVKAYSKPTKPADLLHIVDYALNPVPLDAWQ